MGLVALKVGGLRIICMDTQQDFASGLRVLLTLAFETSGEITVQVSIGDSNTYSQSGYS
jgi:copper(I)-binding protein